jgi:hypothetical protein
MITRFALTLLLVPATAAAQSSPLSKPACTTEQPGPINGVPWTCQNGGWVPGVPPPPPPPTNVYEVPDPRAAQGTFKHGHIYQRRATGTRIFIVGSGQAVNGVAVIVAECLTESTEDLCFYAGQGRFILAHAVSLGWDDHGFPSPYER